MIREQIPHIQDVDGAFLVPNYKVLNEANDCLLSAIGEREGIPQARRCIDFDDIDDEVEIPHSASLTFGDGTNDSPFSITAWVYIREASQFHIFNKIEANDRQFYFATLGSGELTFTLYDSVNTPHQTSTTASFSDYLNQWMFVACSYNGDKNTPNKDLYIYDREGNLIENKTGATNPYNGMDGAANKCHIGKAEFGSSFYSDGRQFDTRVHNTELSQATIEQVMKGKPSGSEVGWWKCEDKAGSALMDSSGQGNHGEVIGHTEAIFYIEDATVPYSFANEVGYSAESNVYTSNYDETDIIIVQDYTYVRGAIDGQQNGISDGTISKDNCLLYYYNSTNLNWGVLRLEDKLQIGRKYRATFSIYIPTSNETIDGFELYTLYNSTTFEYDSVAGSWLDIDVEFVAESEDFNIHFKNGASVQSQNSGFGKGYNDAYIHNFQVKGIDVPRNESNPFYDIDGSDLQYKGKIRQLAKIKNVSVGAFNGTSSFVNVPHNTIFDIGNGTNRPNFGIRAFIYMNDATSFSICSLGNTHSDQSYQFITKNTDQLQFSISEHGSNFSANRISAYSTNTLTAYEGQWIEVRAFYYGGTDYTSIELKAYQIDGTEIDLGVNVDNDLGTFSAIKVGTSDMYIGEYNGSFADGLIYDVRLIDSLNNELSKWTFNEGQGDVVYDLISGNHGVWTGHTDPNQWALSNDAVDYRLVHGYTLNIVGKKALTSISLNYNPANQFSVVVAVDIDLYPSGATNTAFQIKNAYGTFSINTDTNYISFGIRRSDNSVFNTVTPNNVVPTSGIAVFVIKIDTSNATAYSTKLSVNGGTEYPNTDTAGLTYQILSGAEDFKFSSSNSINADPSPVLLGAIYDQHIDNTKINQIKDQLLDYAFGDDVDNLVYAFNAKGERTVNSGTETFTNIRYPKIPKIGGGLDYKGADKEGYIPTELGLQADFQHYKSLSNELPTDFTFQTNDSISANGIYDRNEFANITNKTTKLLVASKPLASFQRLKDFTGTREFIMKIDTTLGTPSTSFTIPNVSPTNNYNVDWGDGTITTGHSGSATHVYNIEGEYIIKVWGNLQYIWFNNTGSNLEHVKEIMQWGSMKWTTFQGAFYGCVNMDITAVDIPDTSSVISFYSAFRACPNLVWNESVNDWDVSNTNIGSVFGYCFYQSTLFNQPLGKWRFNEGGIDVQFMLAETSFNQDISGWNVTAFRNAAGVIRTTPFNQDVSGWNTGNITSMASIFRSTPFNQDISGWDTSSATTMDSMFRSNTAFNQNISGWNTSLVDSMANMFNGASAFNQPIGSWNVSAVTNMLGMFNGASAFNQDLSNWDISAVTTMGAFMSFGTPWSTANYDLALQAWDDLTLQSGVTADFGNSQFTGTVIEAEQSLVGVGTTFDAVGGTSFLSTVSVGDVIENTTYGGMATVAAINSDTQLVLNTADLFASGGNFAIYSNDAAKAKAKLIETYGWTITDGGAV